MLHRGSPRPCSPGPPWLPQWIARSLAAPADQFGVLERALYYIKLTLESDGSREAKAYFGARDAWLVQEQGKVRELSPVPHEPIDDSVPAPSTEAMMERASAALFERQGQNGLWRDFLLFNDESNEWASAFIATALVEACGRRASRAATDAMSRLARQQRPDGGWGAMTMRPYPMPTARRGCCDCMRASAAWRGTPRRGPLRSVLA
ncbi:MAG: hypothetical protein WDN08_22385 [Rhizomicrobium sp.]